MTRGLGRAEVVLTYRTSLRTGVYVVNVITSETLAVKTLVDASTEVAKTGRPVVGLLASMVYSVPLTTVAIL